MRYDQKHRRGGFPSGSRLAEARPRSGSSRRGDARRCKNVKTKETQDQVDLYVKSSTVPCVKSSTESNYQVMSAYANGYYSAKVNKAGTAVSSPDSADKAKYQLADFTMDDSKVYFVKPADWNSSDIKAHFWNSNGKANDIPMDSVSNSVFLKDSKSNTVSNLTLGNNEKLYSVTIPAGMTNVIFYYNNYEYNNYEKQTNDIINISAGNCYKLTEGTTENGTIFNAESIGSVGSLNKLNKSYSFTESTVIGFTDFSAVKTLKMSVRCSQISSPVRSAGKNVGQEVSGSIIA